MMNNQTTLIDVAFAASAGAHVSSAALEVRLRTVAPVMRPVRGELCPQLGWAPTRGQMPIAGAGDTRIGADFADSLSYAYFVKARHGSYAFSGTG